MFPIHIKHSTYHFHLAFRIDQCQQLMNIAIGIPERKHCIAVSLCRHNLITLHCRILSVYILQYIGMNQQMIHGRIENGLLLLRPSLNKNTRQIVVPTFTRFGMYLFKILAFLFFIQIETGIFYTHKRDTQFHFDLFALCGIE